MVAKQFSFLPVVLCREPPELLRDVGVRKNFDRPIYIMSYRIPIGIPWRPIALIETGMYACGVRSVRKSQTFLSEEIETWPGLSGRQSLCVVTPEPDFCGADDRSPQIFNETRCIFIATIPFGRQPNWLFLPKTLGHLKQPSSGGRCGLSGTRIGPRRPRPDQLPES